MRVIILGAGGTSRELLKRLGTGWEIVLVDPDTTQLERAAGIRQLRTVTGDGSSAVVLGRAGLEGAAALVAATSDDDTNLEAVRLAKDAGLLRVVGVARDPERLDEYRALEVPVFSPNALTARNVDLELEPRRVASSAFAAGKAEAIAFRVAPDASVAGKRLRDLHSQTWVVAAVLRGEQLIVPHGDTSLEPGDRVTVVGAASDYPSIVATFTSGVSTFPLGFGRKVAVGVSNERDVGTVVAEAAHLVRNSQADVLSVVVPDVVAGVSDPEAHERLRDAVTETASGIDVEFREARGKVDQGVVRVAREENVGVIVVPGIDPTARYGRFRIARLLNTYAPAGPVPLLLARSPRPYEEILVPARRSAAGEAAARAAIDLARSTGTKLTGVAAVAPAFVATRTDTVEEARLAMAWLREEAAVHDVTVRRRVRQGNPVRVIAALCAPASLLVVGAPETPAGPLTLGISALVAARVPSSVLFVPTRS
jgi:Trk K+ transport system NAD-binding subunit